MAAKSSEKAKQANTEFQAVFLTQVIEQMLPHDAESVYGSGTAGPIWRSMLAEKIAGQLAARDVLGLSSILDRRAAGLTSEVAAKSDPG